MKLKALRAIRNISQEKLAEMADISPVTLRRIENGDWKSSRFFILEQIAEALEMTVQELFLDEEER